MDSLNSSTPSSQTPTQPTRANARLRKRDRCEANAEKARLPIESVNAMDVLSERGGPPHPLQIASLSPRASDYHQSHANDKPIFNPTHRNAALHRESNLSTLQRDSAPAHIGLEEHFRRNPGQYAATNREINQDNYTQESSSSQNIAQFPSSEYTRPEVRLYEYENDEHVTYSRPERRKWADATVPARRYAWQDNGLDTPYMPGPKADNYRRCLAWARSVGERSEEEDATTIDNNGLDK